jgi:hypothetical protein
VHYFGLGAACLAATSLKRARRYPYGYPDHFVVRPLFSFVAAKCLVLLVPGVGFEPTACGLQNRCSTAELTRQINDLQDRS